MQPRCDGLGNLPCDCPAKLRGPEYPCVCDLACDGCDACKAHRDKLAAERAAKDRETADWYYTRVGTRPAEPKGKGGAKPAVAAKGSDQQRLFD